MGRPPGRAFPRLLTIRMDEVTFKRLQKLGKAADTSAATLGRMLVTEGINRMSARAARRADKSQPAQVPSD